MTLHVAPRLAALVAVVALLASGCAVPASSSVTAELADGTVVETDDGRFYFLWDGGRQRIQQPRALVESDLAALGLTVGEPVSALRVIGDEGSFFVMYPADGPSSRLHVAADGTLHPVQVVEVRAEQVDGIPEIDELLITQVGPF